MAGVGANGSVTVHPNCGEKCCVACEYWTGIREVTYNGTAATSRDGQSAFCTMKKENTFPINVCRCNPNSFKKWSYLK